MEGLTRTNATGGLTMITFTPLLGMSDVVSMFLEATA
jgi:phage terminase large subunit-like protein